jgi:hypothetical protein
MGTPGGSPKIWKEEKMSQLPGLCNLDAIYDRVTDQTITDIRIDKNNSFWCVLNLRTGKAQIGVPEKIYKTHGHEKRAILRLGLFLFDMEIRQWFGEFKTDGNGKLLMAKGWSKRKVDNFNKKFRFPKLKGGNNGRRKEK